MAEFFGFLAGILWKLVDSLRIGVLGALMGTVFATLLIARLRMARSLRHAFRLGLVAGAVIGVAFVVVSLCT